MALFCCKNTFRTLEAYEEHKKIHNQGIHIFECPKCGYKSPTLGQMVQHKFIHNREMIAVLEQENKLVQKPWFVPKEKVNDKEEIQYLADSVNNCKEIEQNQNQNSNYGDLDNLDLDSNRDEDMINLARSDSEPMISDIDDPKVIFNDDTDLEHKDDPKSNWSEIADSNMTYSICDTTFHEKSLFEAHVQTHSLSTQSQSNTNSKSVIFKFKCEKCDFKSEDIEEFDTHKKVHYKNEAYLCKKCGRNFHTKSQLLRHNHKMHNKPYVCEICPFQTKYHHNLIRHVRGKHSLNIDLYSTKSIMLNANHHSNSNDHAFNDIVHSKQNYPDKPFKCLKCEKQFVKKIQLENHMGVHSNEKPFHCSLCDYKSKWDKCLKVHMKKHKNTDKLINKEKIKSKVKNDESKLETRSVKTCKCLTCGKTFSNNNGLQKHITVHSEEKPYHCLLCDYKSKWNKNLKVHMKTHENKNKLRKKENIVDAGKSDESKQQDPYVCNFCDYQTKSQSSLKKHVDEFCLKLFNNLKFSNMGDEENVTDDVFQNSKNNKDNHPINVHTANTANSRAKRFYNCNACEYKSKYSGNLSKHILENHKEKYSEMSKLTKKEKNIDLKEKATNGDNGHGENSQNKLLTHKKPQNKSFAKLHPCKFCFYKSVHKSSLTKHISTYHPGGGNAKQKCKVIPQTTKTLNTPTNRLNKKTLAKKQFGCSYCEYTSKHCNNDVKRHMKRIHGKGGTVITKNEAVNTKIIKKSSETFVVKSIEYFNQFHCSYCSFISKRSSEDVHEHMINIHRKTGDIIIRKIMKKIVKTSKNTVLNNDSEIKNKSEGKSKLNNKKVHKCNVCNYTSYEKEYLDKHLTYHSQGNGPVLYYKCPECLQCYKMKARLLLHLKSHIGTQFNGSRICPGCKKTFSSLRRQTFSHIKKCLS